PDHLDRHTALQLHLLDQSMDDGFRRVARRADDASRVGWNAVDAVLTADRTSDRPLVGAPTRHQRHAVAGGGPAAGHTGDATVASVSDLHDADDVGIGNRWPALRPG